MPDDPITITLDRERAIAWTLRARARIDSLARAKKAGGYYQLCCLVWAMLVDREHPFEEPEDVAEYLKTSEQVKAIGAAVVKARERASDSEKNAGRSTPRPSR